MCPGSMWEAPSGSLSGEVEVSILLFAILYMSIGVTVVLIVNVRMRRRPVNGFTHDRCLCLSSIDANHSVRFRGGMWYQNWSATWPHALMQFDKEWIVLTGRIKLRSETFCIQKSQIQDLTVRRGLLGVGIRVRTEGDSTSGVVFWVFSKRDAVAALRGLGWTVAN